MKIAAYQAKLLPAGSMEALASIAERVRWCESEEVPFLLCPEAVLGGLADDAHQPFEFAIDLGELEERLAPLASPSVTVIIGFTEKAGAETLYNSAAVMRGGKMIGLYRKRHPAIRKSIYAAGDESPIFTVDGLNFGIMICNDANFPELAADMVARGAKVIFVPSNNGLRPDKADVVGWTREVDIDRARDNHVVLARADVSGRTAERVAYGSSAIIAADGEVLVAGKTLSEDMLVAEISV